jgi:hemerythrin-like domain-containing protein
MSYVIEVLRQEHCNIETLLGVLERELSVFDHGDCPNYEVVLAVLDYFKEYPDSCHHPKENMIFEKLKSRDPVAVANIGDLEAEHREGATRLRRAAQAIEHVLSDQDLLRQTVDDIIRDFISHERQHMAMVSSRAQRAAAGGLGRYCFEAGRPRGPTADLLGVHDNATMA